MNYFPEFFRLYDIAGEHKSLVNIVPVTRPLTVQEFTPQTIFINQAGSLTKPSGLFELCLLHDAVRKDVPSRCAVPVTALREHHTLLPKGFGDPATPLAFMDPLGFDTTQHFPAVLEFPGDRFFFNFDPQELADTIRRELYFKKKRPLYTYLPFNVQRITPALRQRLATHLKSSKSQGHSPLFPRYPKDYSVEILFSLFAYCVQRIIKREVSSRPWPEGKTFAFIVTHDVDSHWIYQDNHLEAFLAAERHCGIRGAWYFVNQLYRHDFAQIDTLLQEGHEIGLHGDNHDHKMAFLDENSIRRRLDSCRQFIDRYHVTGFRSPHYLRTHRFYDVLKHYLRYDTSMHDAYNPTSAVDQLREGCSTVLPFALSDDQEPLLELPITIPEDFELYNTQKGPSSIIDAQLEQIEIVKQRGGLATLVIHPEPHFTGQKPFFDAFREILRSVSQDNQCWVALPNEIYGYWQERFIPSLVSGHRSSQAN